MTRLLDGNFKETNNARRRGNDECEKQTLCIRTTSWGRTPGLYRRQYKSKKTQSKISQRRRDNPGGLPTQSKHDLNNCLSLRAFCRGLLFNVCISTNADNSFFLASIPPTLANSCWGWCRFCGDLLGVFRYFFKKGSERQNLTFIAPAKLVEIGDISQKICRQNGIQTLCIWSNKCLAPCKQLTCCVLNLIRKRENISTIILLFIWTKIA